MVLLMACGYPVPSLDWIDSMLIIADGHAHSSAISVCNAVLLHGYMMRLWLFLLGTFMTT